MTLKRGQHRVAQAICEDPLDTIPDRCVRTEMTTEEESVNRKAVVNFGLVRLSGCAGNRRRIYEATQKGTAWRKIHGFRTPRWHGSVLHQFCTRRTAKRLAEAIPGTKVEYRGTGEPGGVRPDALLVLPGQRGWRVALQTVVAHNPNSEAVNLLRLCGMWPKNAESKATRNAAGWVDRVVCIAINRRVQDCVEKAVEERNEGQIPEKLAFIDAESVLTPSCDVTWVLREGAE